MSKVGMGGTYHERTTCPCTRGKEESDAADSRRKKLPIEGGYQLKRSPKLFQIEASIKQEFQSSRPSIPAGLNLQ